MYIIYEADASSFKCPTRKQNCQGEKCLAWEYTTKTKYIGGKYKKVKDYERGFCSLTNKTT